jgi:hypothetical protein
MPIWDEEIAFEALLVFARRAWRRMASMAANYFTAAK